MQPSCLRHSPFLSSLAEAKDLKRQSFAHLRFFDLLTLVQNETIGGNIDGRRHAAVFFLDKRDRSVYSMVRTSNHV